MSLNWNNAIWLAKRQMRDMWTAYVYTAVYFAFMGAVLAADTGIATEIALPVLMLILIQPAVSSRYMTWKQDNEVTRHQTFLRSLPLELGTIVAARFVAMLVAGVINIPMFFVWFWYLADEWSSVSVFLVWAVFWIGMALAGAGISLIQEFWLSIRRWSMMNFLVIMVLIVTLPPIFWLTGIRPVAWTIDYAHRSPGVLATAGFFVGVLGLVIGIVIAVRCFCRREFAL